MRAFPVANDLGSRRDQGQRSPGLGLPEHCGKKYLEFSRRASSFLQNSRNATCSLTQKDIIDVAWTRAFFLDAYQTSHHCGDRMVEAECNSCNLIIQGILVSTNLLLRRECLEIFNVPWGYGTFLDEGFDQGIFSMLWEAVFFPITLSHSLFVQNQAPYLTFWTQD